MPAVSQATVSSAWRTIRASRRRRGARLQAVARKLGYRPNPYVAALMRSRRRGKPLPVRPVLAVICTHDRARRLAEFSLADPAANAGGRPGAGAGARLRGAGSLAAQGWDVE